MRLDAPASVCEASCPGNFTSEQLPCTLGDGTAEKLGGNNAEKLGGGAAEKLGGGTAEKLGGGTAEKLGGGTAEKLGGGTAGARAEFRAEFKRKPPDLTGAEQATGAIAADCTGPSPAFSVPTG